jgi:hypothetical protein
MVKKNRNLNKKINKLTQTVNNVANNVKNNNNNRRRRQTRNKRRYRRTRKNTNYRNINAPVSKGNIGTYRKAKITNEQNGIRINHSEYFADVYLPAGFAVSSFVINPSNQYLFPWLSTIANNYETYCFDNLSIVYRPKCSTSNEGSLISYIDYDASDPQPVNKITMMSGAHTDSNCWVGHVHKCSKQNLHKLKQRYIKSGITDQSVMDTRLNDTGIYYIGTQNNGVGSIAGGELHVNYTIRFMTPQLPNSVNPSYSADMYWTQTGGGWGEDNKKPLGPRPNLTEQYYSYKKPFRILDDTTTQPYNAIQFNYPGKYQITCMYYRAIIPTTSGDIDLIWNNLSEPGSVDTDTGGSISAGTTPEPLTRIWWVTANAGTQFIMSNTCTTYGIDSTEIYCSYFDSGIFTLDPTLKQKKMMINNKNLKMPRIYELRDEDDNDFCNHELTFNAEPISDEDDDKSSDTDEDSISCLLKNIKNDDFKLMIREMVKSNIKQCIET